MGIAFSPDDIDFKDHDWTLLIDSGEFIVQNDSTGRQYVFTPSSSADADAVARIDDTGAGGGSSVSVEEDDTEVVGTLSTLNFEDALTVTDEGSGKVTVDAGLAIEDDRTAITTAREINAGTDLTVTDDGAGVVTIDSTASGSSSPDTWPATGEILVDGESTETSLATALSNVTDYMVLGDGSFSGEGTLPAGATMLGPGPENCEISCSGDGSGGTLTAGIASSGDAVRVEGVSISQSTDADNALRLDGERNIIRNIDVDVPGTATVPAVVNGGNYALLDRIHVDSPGNTGIQNFVSGTEVGGIRIQNCVVLSAGNRGIRSNVQRTTFANNVVVSSTDDGIYMNGADSTATGNVVLNSTARDIDIGGANCTLVGNRAADVAGDLATASYAGNNPRVDVVTSGTVALSSGAAVVNTGITTTGVHFDVYLDPSGGGANAADVKCAARAFWDNSAGEYAVEILEDGTSVGNPTIGYEVVRS